MTPAGRCVAMIRWMPSERPRWATSTTPSTNSGTSPTSAANSSITMHERGRRLRIAAALELEQVLRLLAGEQQLAVVQLGAEAGERAADEVRREVGDDADGVRQGGALRERRAALVVDEQERHPVRAVLRRHAEHPRLQELALARAGRPADERVRALGPQVEPERVAGRLADDRSERRPARRRRGSRSRCGRGWTRSAATGRPRPPGSRRARCRAARASSPTAADRSRRPRPHRRRRRRRVVCAKAVASSQAHPLDRPVGPSCRAGRSRPRRRRVPSPTSTKVRQTAGSCRDVVGEPDREHPGVRGVLRQLHQSPGRDGGVGGDQQDDGGQQLGREPARLVLGVRAAHRHRRPLVLRPSWRLPPQPRVHQ